MPAIHLTPAQAGAIAECVSIVAGVAATEGNDAEVRRLVRLEWLIRSQAGLDTSLLDDFFREVGADPRADDAPPPAVYRLDPDERPTLECACGSGEGTVAWGSSDLPDGYVDACSKACAERFVRDLCKPPEGV